MPRPHVDSEFGKKIHRLSADKVDTEPEPPAIDKKSDLGRYLYNFHKIQCLHQPWYAQRYKFWGQPNEKFYKSISVKLSGLLLIILMVLIVIPPLGIASIPYPINTTKTIDFSSGQTVNFNDHYSESAFLSKGNTISYKLYGNHPFSFAISAQPFINFPLTNNRHTGSFNSYFNVKSGESKFIQIYLNKGDKLSYNFTSGLSTPKSTDFIISTTTNLEKPKLVFFHFTTTANGTFVSPQSQYYWVGFAFDDGTITSRNIIKTTFDYNVSSVDLTKADLSYINTTNIQQNTFTVPSSGTYSFYVYLDPAVNSSAFTDVSMTIFYHQQLSGNDNWIHISTYLEVLALAMAAMIAITYYQHEYSKRFEKAKKIYYSDYSLKRACYSCRELVLERDINCPHCGSHLKDNNNHE